MAGGFLADRLSKRTVMIGVKVFEVGVMIFVLAGFAWHKGPMLLAGIFLMGTHSAFFGPSKYGSLPELLPERRLSWGNGILELGTFTAIILGTVAAAAMDKAFAGRQIWSGAVLIGLALAGLGASLGITRVPARIPQKPISRELYQRSHRAAAALRGDRPLVLAADRERLFQFLGSLLLLNLFSTATGVLHVSKMQIGH